MNLFHIGSEFKRFFRGKLGPLALLVIILLPLLFGGLLVWSYWDPVGRINRLPVALVNSDTGAELDGERVNVGDQIVENLLANDQITLTEVSPEEATQGIEDGTYYFGIEFPEDFSEAATSVSSDNPHQATLNAVYNNNNGFLAQVLGNNVVMVVLNTINTELGSQVADRLLVGFNTLGEGMRQAGDGAQQLNDGAQRAKDGGTELASGASQLNDGLKAADDGAQQLASGAQQLDQGLATASNGADQLARGLGQLNDATDTLGNGAGQVSEGVNRIVDLANSASQAQENLLIPLVNLSAQLRSTGVPQALSLAEETDKLITQLRTQGVGSESEIIGQLNQLKDGAAEIHRQLVDPAADYRAGVNRATDASAQLATGLHTLKDGSQKLVVGARTLASGTSKLSAGSTQLTVGANQLADGLVQLDAGSGELALKINEGAMQVPQFGDDIRSDAARSVSTPVMQVNPKHTMSLFGEGLSPMFISIGLFIGATVTFMVMRPLHKRAIDSGMSSFRVAVVSYLPPMLVGLAQATIMFLVQKQFIGLEAAHEWGLWAGMCIISMSFMALVQGINSALGATVGRVICLGLMSLQMVSSGGLYPPETQPAPLRFFHNYDPMTYSVNLIRHAIVGVDNAADPRAMQAIAVLACVAVVFFAITVLAARKERQMSVKDLHPEISV